MLFAVVVFVEINRKHCFQSNLHNIVSTWKTNTFNSSPTHYCRTVVVLCIHKSMNYWDLFSADYSMMCICTTPVWYSFNYALLSKRGLKGVCICHWSVCAGLRSIFPAGLFHHTPKFQMEGSIHTSKFQFWFLYQICQVSCSFKIEEYDSKTYVKTYFLHFKQITPTNQKGQQKALL